MRMRPSRMHDTWFRYHVVLESALIICRRASPGPLMSAWTSARLSMSLGTKAMPSGGERIRSCISRPRRCTTEGARIQSEEEEEEEEEVKEGRLVLDAAVAGPGLPLDVMTTGGTRLMLLLPSPAPLLMGRPSWLLPMRVPMLLFPPTPPVPVMTVGGESASLPALGTPLSAPTVLSPLVCMGHGKAA